MTIAADWFMGASGTTTPTEPPPDLANADDARSFYLAGIHGISASGFVSFVTKPFHNLVSRPVRYGEPVAPGLWLLLERIASELTRLSQLRPGWDGHRAVPITKRAIWATAMVLARIADETSELPQFFPLPDGGIQLEWYAGDDIEIEIDGSGEVEVLITRADGETVREGSFDPYQASEMADDVTSFLRRLSARVAAERQGT